MADYQNILQEYWGFDSFRPLQLDVIQDIAKGKDTLALMPTGGGKSITFQVYSLSQEGICLVITPLISLMKDQVEKLKNKNIKALAIHSGLTGFEIKVALDNAVWGDYKFLYISPERLNSKRFLEKLAKMNVNLIAVDEAHCISQWGYDFRPSYLNIAKLREKLPDVTFLALTATATAKVVEDIQEKLEFKAKNVRLVSFERKNLKYLVRKSENKIGYIIEAVKRSKGSGLIYVRSRKGTKEIANLLKYNGIAADFYHAGLSSLQRNRKQEEWTVGKTRVMVATNAFGMGIDKADVRFVLHYDIPDSLEAYFQEAGRAGRDQQKAAAVLLYNNADKTKLKKQHAMSYPSKEYIKKVYRSLCNYLQIAEGFGLGQAYEFHLQQFAQAFNLQRAMVYSSLKILQRDGYIEYTEDVDSPSRVFFRVSRDELYRFQSKEERFDEFIKVLLRSYTGLFNAHVYIDEELLANRAKILKDTVFDFLKQISKLKIISYIPRNQLPVLRFTRDREKMERFTISKRSYESRKVDHIKRIESVIGYAENDFVCRSKFLLNYFDEKDANSCGVCDVCLSRKQGNLKHQNFIEIEKKLQKLLQTPMTINQLLSDFTKNPQQAKDVIRWLLDNNKITLENNEFKWN